MSAETGLRARLRGGEVVVGMMVVDFFTPALPRVLAQCGVDFAVYDMESTGLDHLRLETMIALSRAVGLAPLVRVPSVSTGEIGRCLDLGAAGVMAPKIDDLDDAMLFAAAMRFPPDGVRGSGYQAYPSGYVTPTSASDRTAANDEVVAICQLESAEAIDHAESIIAVPGIDVVNVGVNDLSARLGVLPSAPSIRDAVVRVQDLCAEHGKAFGGRSPSAVGARTSFHPAHRLVLIDHDIAALAAHTRATVAAVREEAVS